jgi:hypothetical protein
MKFVRQSLCNGLIVLCDDNGEWQHILSARQLTEPDEWAVGKSSLL